MSDEVLRTEDGIEHLAYVGEIPWHRFGTKMPDGTNSAIEAAKIAHIDEIVIDKEALYVKHPNGLYVPLSDQVSLVRLPYASEPEPKRLGVVDSKYEPVQNAAIAEYLEPLCNHLKIDVVAALWEGTMTFFSFKDENGLFDILLPNGKRDQLMHYLLVVENKKPGHAIKFIDTNIRVVCANTETAAEDDALWEIDLSHKDGANRMMKFTGQALSQLASSQKALKQAYQSMANTPITDDNVQRFIGNVWTMRPPTTMMKLGKMHFGDRVDADGLTGDELEFWGKYMSSASANARGNAFASKCQTEARRIYENDPAQQDIKGTVWGAYNMATSLAEHYQNTAGTTKIAISNIEGERADMKKRAYKAAMSLTGDIRWKNDFDWESPVEKPTEDAFAAYLESLK